MGFNRDLLEHYVERYNAGDLDACMDLYADDAVQIMPEGTFEGRSAIHDRLARDLDAFSDLVYSVRSFVEHDDTFADEWTMVGHHTGPITLPDGTSIPPTGNRVEIRGMEFVKLRNGNIVVDNLYYDNAAFVAQLGLAPQLATV